MAVPVADALSPGLPAGDVAAAGRFSRTRGALRTLEITIPAAVLLLLLFFCFVWPLIYPVPKPTGGSILDSGLPVWSPGHIFGTDNVGNDIMARILYGGQVSFEVAFAVQVIGLVVGGTLGVIAGYFGGPVDSVLMRIVDIVLAVPVVYLFIDLASVFKPTLLLLIVVLSLLSWLGPARLVRGETLSLRVREYIQAVKVMGGRSGRIIFRHLVPNTMGTITVNATFQVADAILTLAVLSYLGFSLPPPAATWGGMLQDGVNFLYDGYWWEIYPAGLMIVITVVAFNFIGDGLRDSLDVRLQRR